MLIKKNTRRLIHAAKYGSAMTTLVFKTPPDHQWPSMSKTQPEQSRISVCSETTFLSGSRCPLSLPNKCVVSSPAPLASQSPISMLSFMLSEANNSTTPGAKLFSRPRAPSSASTQCSTLPSQCSASLPRNPPDLPLLCAPTMLLKYRLHGHQASFPRKHRAAQAQVSCLFRK